MNENMHLGAIFYEVHRVEEYSSAFAGFPHHRRVKVGLPSYPTLESAQSFARADSRFHSDKVYLIIQCKVAGLQLFSNMQE